MERYRSGYNGTVLKTVVRQRTVGSNPTLSAKGSALSRAFIKLNNSESCYQWRSTQVGAKGVGRVTGARVRVSPSPPNRNRHPFGCLFLFIFSLKTGTCSQVSSSLSDFICYFTTKVNISVSHTEPYFAAARISTFILIDLFIVQI